MANEHNLSTSLIKFEHRDLGGGSQSPLNRFTRSLINKLNKLTTELIKVINKQSIKYFAQDSAPTTSQLSDGRMALWKDTDAGGGSPTHYLVMNDAGTIITFASEETA